MLKKLIKAYYKLLDEKLENGTAIVIIIAFIVVGIGLISQTDKTNSYYKANLMETSYINIEGKKYKINLEEIN